MVVKKLVSVPVVVSLYLLILFCLMFYLSGRPNGTVGRGSAWIAGIALVVIFFVLVFQSHGRHNTILVLRWLAILLVAVLAVNLVQVIVVWTVPDADGFSAQFGRGCISGAASGRVPYDPLVLLRGRDPQIGNGFHGLTMEYDFWYFI